MKKIIKFSNLIATSSSSRVGPYGNVYYGNALAYAKAGDVIFADWGGSPTATTIDHAMLVRKTTGTSGSQSGSTIYIASHTNDYGTDNDTLSSPGYSDSCYARASILGGYYKTSQS